MFRRTIAAAVLIGAIALPAWGDDVAGGLRPAPTVAAVACSPECDMGLHEFCPDAFESTEDFSCTCPCHDTLFELEATELWLDR